MTADADAASAAASSKKAHAKSHSRSLSLRGLPSRLRQKRAVDPSGEASTSTLAPPISPALKTRRSSAPEEGSQTPEWRSNQFSTPPESDAEFVRRTYAHFSIAGVPDDGFADGKEYTREKNGLSAWEEAALSRPSSTRVASGPVKRAVDPAVGNGVAVGGSEMTPTASGNEKGNGHIPHALNASASIGSALSQLSSAAANQDAISSSPGRPPFPASPSAETSISNNTFLSTNERQRRQELAEKKREQLIANIDRYGFFAEGSSSAHHKAVLLPSSVFSAPFPKKGAKGIANQNVALPKSLSSQPSKAEASSQAIGRAPSAADAVHREREQERVAKWARMMTVKDRDQGHNALQFDFANGIDRKLRRRVYKGIPDSWRSAAWSALIAHRSRTAEGRESFSLAKPHLQTHTTSGDTKHFERLKEQPSPHDVQIDLDVPRTISGHIQFHTRYGQGQRSLFHVLHSISLLCDQCGYCQGMGPIAATLLCYFTPERAYSTMVLLHNHLSLHSTFSPGFPGLVENLFVQDKLLRTFMPELAAVFDQQMVLASSYATKWYITLFSNSIPFETQLRVWDAWLLDGGDVIVLVAVAVIWAHRGVILGEKADFETVLSALSSYFVPEDDDGLMFWVQEAMGRKDIRQTIRKAREEFQAKVKSGKADGLML